jgi:hypothetical protein
LIFIYCGHGDEEFFSPNGSLLHYGYFSKEISKHKGKFIFINDSCNSGASIEFFEKRDLLRRGMVITSCNKEEYAYGATLLGAIARSYVRRQVFRRKKISYRECWSESEVINYIKDNKEYLDVKCTALEKPIIPNEKIQHPIKRGKTLDYLLIPDEGRVSENKIREIIIDGLNNARLYL